MVSATGTSSPPWSERLPLVPALHPAKRSCAASHCRLLLRDLVFTFLINKCSNGTLGSVKGMG